MPVNLPDLKIYRAAFVGQGVGLPLLTVEYQDKGLLSRLPAADSGRQGWPWTQEVDASCYATGIAWPKLTIVTPSYNQAAFLEETIRSVLLQNYPNLEYIVIDGGSSDGSAEIIQKYSPWLSFWKSEKDNGQSNAINQGFSLASGKYYAWINSDDYYLENTFLKVIGAFISTKAMFVYGYVLDYLVSQKQFGNPAKILPVLDYLLRLPSLAQPSCFWDNSIHQPLWEELHCAMDYELWLRIVKGNKRHLIKTPLSVANIHDDAKTSDPLQREKWHEDHLLICSPEAHGPVNDWNRRTLVNRIRIKLYKWLKLG